MSRRSVVYDYLRRERALRVFQGRLTQRFGLDKLVAWLAKRLPHPS